MKKIRVDSALYGNVILIVILASNIWSSHGQNVNPPHDDAADYVGPGGGGSGGGGNGAADGDRVASSGEVMASRLPVLNEHEPSCEELKAMWRFSRRQSRTSEMSNELPTYRDPFKHNIWDPYYPTMRSVNRGRATPRYFGSRSPMQPTYGTINYKAPEKTRLPVGRTRSFNYNDLSRIYSKTEIQKAGREPYNWAAAAIANRNNNNNNDSLSRRRTQFRNGGRVQTHNVPLNSILTPQKGSFQRLKELIWNERARELAQQRRNEEMIARAAVLKELTNGQRFKRSIFYY
ncbi:uncharacterized protein LOC129575024 isoform X3 [Sitodiplosis mosellana]|uniref:uncharacterized protein LOC129575024 isoform X3 n=1 Tax=Sitodiplosis mosellana TaxID=263140 RepID=UPI0024448D09|nr:uncharacterized protein LOC129575024 isoform X3 [Sitodiplosis mosellana]